jgi:DNA polymerase
MFVGEQPGDKEDRAGHPFVGPAGGLLRRATDGAGIDLGAAYVTNAVKHFKWEPSSNQKVRIHKTPNAREIRACRPWWEAEVELVSPDVVCCLGAVAAKALLGPDVRITRDRGRLLRVDEQPFSVVVTVHPAAVLRAGPGRDAAFAGLVSDLRTVAECLAA